MLNNKRPFENNSDDDLDRPNKKVLKFEFELNSNIKVNTK